MVQTSFWSFCSNKILQAIAQECSAEKYEWWFWNFLLDWQSLAAGLIALFGAVILAVQVRIQAREFRRQREKEELEARLLLPHALADIHRYLEKMGKAWISEDMSSRPSPLTERQLRTLITAATVADEKTLATVRELIISLQTFESQLDDTFPVNYLDSVIFNIAHLWVLTNSLYDFGRSAGGGGKYIYPNRKQLYDSLYHPLELYRLMEHDPIILRIKQGLKISE